MNPRKASARRVLRDGTDGTSSHREQSPEVDRVRTLPMGARRSHAGNARRARGLREGTRSMRGERLEGRSRRTLRSRKAAGGTVVDVAKEVTKPRTRHGTGLDAPRATGPPPRHVSYGTKAQGRKHRSTSRLRPTGRCGGAAMDLGREAKARGGPSGGESCAKRRSATCPEGVKTPCGLDGTNHRRERIGSRASGCRASSSEGRSRAARREIGSYHCSSLRRAAPATRPFVVRLRDRKSVV